LNYMKIEGKGRVGLGWVGLENSVELNNRLNRI